MNSRISTGAIFKDGSLEVSCAPNPEHKRTFFFSFRSTKNKLSAQPLAVAELPHPNLSNYCSSLCNGGTNYLVQILLACFPF